MSGGGANHHSCTSKLRTNFYLEHRKTTRFVAIRLLLADLMLPPRDDSWTLLCTTFCHRYFTVFLNRFGCTDDIIWDYYVDVTPRG